MKNIFTLIRRSAAGKTKTVSDDVRKTIDEKKTYFFSLNKKGQNRLILLVIAGLVIVNYLMITYHTGHNPLDIFPSLPIIDTRDKITVYLPSEDGTFLTETRKIEISDNKTDFAARLVRFVTAGSAFENTRAISPIQGIVRAVWFNESTCIIDMANESRDEDAVLIPGSEELYRQAVEKTIIKNINGVKKVIILENGITGRIMWDFPSTVQVSADKTK